MNDQIHTIGMVQPTRYTENPSAPLKQDRLPNWIFTGPT